MKAHFRIHPDYTSLIATLVVSSLLLISDVPNWAALSTVLFFIWRLLIEYFRWPTPSRWLTGFLSVIFLVATLYTFKSWIGKEVSACFLMILTSLKILELQEESEKSFLILLGFFLVSSKFLFSLDLIYVAIEIPMLLILIYNLLPTQFMSNNPWGRIQYVFKVIVLTIPLTAFLYVFFPRFTQKFIEVQGLQDKIGISGFSDSIQPGQVSQLAQSNELVFRAELMNEKISSEDLYWKGQILTESKGMLWKRGLLEISEEDPLPFAMADYKIILEPTGRRWLFFLDDTVSIKTENFKFQKTSGNVFFSVDNLSARSQYVGKVLKNQKPISDRDYNVLKSKLQATQKDPAILEIIKGFNGDNHDPDIFAKNLLHYYQSNHFYYTLRPGDQGDLQLIDFLLKSKKGFCEHYASSAALLFRAANIPSRVVVGYQGGVFNRNGRFWSVTQKDAHAWIEYLNSQKIWTRLDPTSAIAPLRLELGAQAYFNLNENEIQSLSKEELKKRLENSNFIEDVEFWFENINYKWNTWLLDYDLEKQKAWLEKYNMSLTSLSLIALVLSLLATALFQFLVDRKNKKTDYEILIEALNKALKKRELERLPTEGPLEWKNRLQIQSSIPQRSLDLLFEFIVSVGYKNKSIAISAEQRKIFFKIINEI